MSTNVFGFNQGLRESIFNSKHQPSFDQQQFLPLRQLGRQPSFEEFR